MTPEQLDMHKRLQPLYKRVMGEWQVGDKFYPITFDSQYQLFVTDRGNYGLSDQFGSMWNMSEVYRIPLAIDSEHPERGLWGMLNKENLGKMHTKILDTGVLSYMLGGRDWCIDDPTTAILKALCEQEGV